MGESDFFPSRMGGLRLSHLQSASITHIENDHPPEALEDPRATAYYLPELFPPKWRHLHPMGRLSAIGPKRRPIGVDRSVRRDCATPSCQKYILVVQERLRNIGQFGISGEGSRELPSGQTCTT